MEEETTILAVETEGKKFSQELSSVFSMCFKDEKEEIFEGFLDKIHQKTDRNIFNKLQFHESIQMNFEYASRTQ